MCVIQFVIKMAAKKKKKKLNGTDIQEMTIPC